MCEASNFEEPRAVVPHAGICTGRSGNWPSYRDSKLILFGEASLRRTLREYLVHYHVEQNHQGKDNVLLFPAAAQAKNRIDGLVRCEERLGGLLKYYLREAA